METILATFLQPTIRNAATVAATVLIAKGFLAPEQAGAFVDIAGGAALGGFAYIWSLVKSHKAAKVEKALKTVTTPISNPIGGRIDK